MLEKINGVLIKLAHKFSEFDNILMKKYWCVFKYNSKLKINGWENDR